MMLDKEKGSLTILAMWLTAIMMMVTPILFLLSNRESQLVVLGENNLQLQLLAESVLTRQHREFEKDHAKFLAAMTAAELRPVDIATGEERGMTYRVCVKTEEGRLVLSIWVEKENGKLWPYYYGQQWWLRLNENTEKVELERVG